MIGLVNYNFFGDGNALDPMPTKTGALYPTLSNGVFDQFTITKNIIDDSSTPPTAWDNDTILSAYFNGTLAAGNIEEQTANITAVRIKRRKLGTFEWLTIAEKSVSSVDDIDFIVNDNIAEGNTEYEYAFVPVVNGVEGSYSIQSIISKFNGVFMSDSDNIFRLDAAVSYGVNSAVTKRGVYEPYGRKYPVVISNGVNNYETGSVSGIILPDDYDPKNPIPRKEIVDQRRLFINFLNNRRPKLLRDWNGNVWIISITDNPTTTYLTGSGMGMMDVTASWTEVGDYNDKQDLYDSGLVPTIQ